MTSVKIEGYRGVATEATVLSPRPTFGPLSLSLATLNLLSHYFNGAARRSSPAILGPALAAQLATHITHRPLDAVTLTPAPSMTSSQRTC